MCVFVEVQSSTFDGPLPRFLGTRLLTSNHPDARRLNEAHISRAEAWLASAPTHGALQNPSPRFCSRHEKPEETVTEFPFKGPLARPTFFVSNRAEVAAVLRTGGRNPGRSAWQSQWTGASPRPTAPCPLLFRQTSSEGLYLSLPRSLGRFFFIFHLPGSPRIESNPRKGPIFAASYKIDTPDAIVLVKLRLPSPQKRDSRKKKNTFVSRVQFLEGFFLSWKCTGPFAKRNGCVHQSMLVGGFPLTAMLYLGLTKHRHVFRTLELGS